jgi:FkbM family methyltransferase
MNTEADCSNRVQFQSATSAVTSVLPDFFHIGPPKTATTWLHSALSGRVRQPEPLRRTFFFNHNFDKGVDWYRSRFRAGSRMLTCEIEPEYFFSQEAAGRIKTVLPKAKIICTLRDPIERLYSYYKYEVRFGAFEWSFEDALEKHSFFLSSALYAQHLRRWLEVFGRENVLVTFYEDLLSEPQAFLNRVCDFIGLPRFQLSPGQRDRVNASNTYRIPASAFLARLASQSSELLQRLEARRVLQMLKRSGVGRFFYDNGREFPPLDPKIEYRLRLQLLPEIEQLERLSGRDLSAWKVRMNSAAIRADESSEQRSSIDRAMLSLSGTVTKIRALRGAVRNWPSCLIRFGIWRGVWQGIHPPIWKTRRGSVIRPPSNVWYNVWECLACDSYDLDSLEPERKFKWFIDIGANIGCFSISLLERFPDVRGIACEPISDMYRSLLNGIRENRLEAKISARQIAVTGNNGPKEVSLWYRPNAPGNTSASTTGDGGQWERAPGVSIRDLLNELDDEIDLVKLDVEGAEYDIILSTPPEFLRRSRRLVLEYHDVPGHSWRELVSHLEAAGLKLRRHDQSLLWFGPWHSSVDANSPQH